MPSSDQIAEVAEAFEKMIRVMVSEKSAVSISCSQRNIEQPVVLKLRVAAHDMGRVIGMGGRSAKALRVLLNSISQREDVGFQLDIAEDS